MDGQRRTAIGPCLAIGMQKDILVVGLGRPSAIAPVGVAHRQRRQVVGVEGQGGQPADHIVEGRLVVFRLGAILQLPGQPLAVGDVLDIGIVPHLVRAFEDGRALAVDDCAYANGTGGGTYTRIGIDTLRAGVNGIRKHVIVTINASETKLYIEDDYYENLSDPEPLETFDTYDIFSPAQLASGLRVYVLAARHIHDLAVGEVFEGVKVERILTPVPADCNEVISMGEGLTGDVNSDCSVDSDDLWELAQLWLECVDPQDALCGSPWD